ncbi:DUF4329 domain-containing protein [Rhodophyticola sp. SM2404]
MRRLIAALALLVFSNTANAQSAEETEFMIALMHSMNPASIQNNREICGHVLRGPNGRMTSSKISWGGPASCASLPIAPGVEVLSSWHTHAAWAPSYDNEVPSTVDVEGDLSRGINGWVGTPGGRLWFINGQTGDMHQVCEEGCLPVDPNIGLDGNAPVAKNYTLEELYTRFGR